MSDVDEAGLSETVRLCSTTASRTTFQVLDVADYNAVTEWAAQVVDDHGQVNLIFNNAGVALSATVEGMSYEDLRWLMDINFWGVVHGTKAFLPHLQAADEGHVINISSVFGLLSIPSQSAYNASKFAVRGFTDALRIELDAERSSVSATTIHPGGIKTNIARRARFDASATSAQERDAFIAEFDKIARTSPERAAEQILVAVQRNRRRALIGPDAVVFDVVSRLPAGLYQRVLALGARRDRKRRAT